MDRVATDELEPERTAGGAARTALADALGATDVAVNRYRVEPGKRLAGLHAHVDQEELFLVVEGTLTFETLEGTVEVGAGEAVRFAPGEFQSGKNASGRAAAVVGVGAPRGSDGLRVPLHCTDCGYGTLRPRTGGDGHGSGVDGHRSSGNDDGSDDGDGSSDHNSDDGATLVCPDCGSELDGSCPDCGSDEVLVTLEGESAVARCRVCDAAAWPRPANRNH